MTRFSRNSRSSVYRHSVSGDRRLRGASAGWPCRGASLSGVFIAVFPEKIADDPAAQSILESVNLAFPGIATLAAPDQIEMGKQLLEAALKDPGLAADPKTEPSP